MRISILWQQGLSDQKISHTLNQEGFVTIDGGKHNRISVLRLRLKQGWQRRKGNAHHAEKINGLFTVRGLANACNIEPEWIRWSIHSHNIDPALVSKHPQLHIYLIDASPAFIEMLSHKVANRKYYKTRAKEQTS